MKPFEYRNFDYSGWERPEHIVVKKNEIKAEIFNKGYYIIPSFISENEIEELKNNYLRSHDIHASNGGFFVSVYSKNIDYRQQVHDKIRETAGEKFDALFHNHKYTCFSYAVKYPGKKGELFIHQDMAQADEFKHSQVGIWLPLQDVNIENGTIGILPYSHFTIPPHRTLYHNLPFCKIYPTVFKYMQPLELKAGDLLLFDTRLFHNSFINASDEPRIAIASSVVPENAPFCVCYRDAENKNETGENEYELIEVSDRFYLDFKDFKSEKIFRPEGKTGRKIIIKERFVDEDEFIEFCKIHNIKPHNNLSFYGVEGTNSINEPDYHEQTPQTEIKKQTFFERIKQFAGIN